MRKEWENASGCPDPTAYAATKSILEEEARVSRLVHSLRELAALAGFEVINRIELRGIKSRRTYR